MDCDGLPDPDYATVAQDFVCVTDGRLYTVGDLRYVCDSFCVLVWVNSLVFSSRPASAIAVQIMHIITAWLKLHSSFNFFSLMCCLN